MLAYVCSIGISLLAHTAEITLELHAGLFSSGGDCITDYMYLHTISTFNVLLPRVWSILLHHGRIHKRKPKG